MEQRIIFNMSKNELFKLTENYKTLHRKMKTTFKVEINRSDITLEILKLAKIFVLCGPQEKFTEQEFQHLKDYVTNGGNLIVMLGEGGEIDFNTNVNFFLEEYGMSINNDAVVRPHYYKYFHPKEALISGGVAIETIVQELITNNKNIISTQQFMEDKYKIEFIYPFGATMNVVQPSNVLLTTGPVTYPFNRPIVGLYIHESGGKILATGSGHMFQDKYINHDTNLMLWDHFLNILLDKTNLPLQEFSDVEVNDFAVLPDTIYLADQPKLCLVESIDCDIPSDFRKMFDMSLHSINNNLLKDVIVAYEKLDVKYEPLKIIKPQFEIPLPPLQLAVFQPIFSDLTAPPLELFDLEEAFSSVKAQLTQLTNKCLAAALNNDGKSSKKVNEKELEYFIQECGRILNIFQEDQKWPAKEIVNHIGVQIAQYKKLDHE